MATQTASPFRAALGNRDFRRLLQSLAISAAGDWIYGIALIVFVFERTHSPAWVGAASILRLLPYILFSALGGVVADRLDRRSVMIVSDVARAGLMFVIAGAAAAGAPVGIAIALAFVATALGTAYQPAFSAMTPSLVPENNLAPANALIAVVDHVALVVGPATGGLLLLVGDAWIAFTMNGISFLVSAALVVGVKRRPRTRVEPEGGLSERILEGLRAILGSLDVLVMVSFSVAASFMYGIELVVLVLVSERLLGTGSEGVGFLDAAIGVGGVLAAVFTNRLAQDPRAARSLGIGIFLSSIPFAGLAVVRVPAIAYGLMVLVGAGGIIIHVMSETTLQRTLPEQVLARVFGVLDSIAVAGILLGSIVAPILVEAFGLKPALVIAGASLPVVLLLSAPKLRSLDERATRRAQELAPRVELLQGLPIFAGAPRRALEALASVLSEERVQPKETIIREGDIADAFFVLVSGSADVKSKAATGRRRRINQLNAGDYFGEIGIVERIPRTATVIATADSLLYKISAEDFLDVVNQSPGISRALIAGISGRLARTHPKLEVAGAALEEAR